MQHYISFIISQGSENGYNTEASECLCIDYAKKAYWASNKEDYPVQVVRWFNFQESCKWFADYLKWSMLEYLNCQDWDGGLDIESEGEEDEINHRELEPEEDAADINRYIITKYPPNPQTFISSLIDLFSATTFLPIFTAHLEQSPNTLPQAPRPSLSTHLPVFKCFTVYLPPIVQVTNYVTQDVVYACCASP